MYSIYFLYVKLRYILILCNSNKSIFLINISIILNFCYRIIMFVYFYKTIFTYFIIILIYINFSVSQDLTRQDPIEKIVYFKGVSGESHYYEPSELIFETGELYKLKLINNSDSKHYFSSSSFSKSIFTRKIQVNFKSKKLAEVKGIINEVEVWPNHEIEWWFVPIKTGRFEDLYCRVEDMKNGLKHSEMGMQGVIIIK